MSTQLKECTLKELYNHLDNHIKMFENGVPLTDQVLDSYLFIKYYIKKKEDEIPKGDLTPVQKFKKKL